jgi:hypothetical protein
MCLILLLGAKPVDTLLLLRDMLYLLQGIDGKHIRFARKTQAQKNREANPYNVDIEFTRKGEEDHLTKERRKEKARENLLLGGGVEDEDITGIAFVDDIGNVSIEVTFPFSLPEAMRSTRLRKFQRHCKQRLSIWQNLGCSIVVSTISRE